MKRLFKVFAAAALTTAATGCDSFLDVNENVNAGTTSTPDAILAQALTTTASNYSIGYNHYSSFTTGYFAKSGTVNGYPEERTLTYTSNFQAGLFNGTYNNLEDYETIRTQGKELGFLNHAAIGRIMRVYNYQLLVDQYGDIPYTDALKGLNTLTPKYDDDAAIYQDFIVELNGAIADIAAATNAPVVGQEDVVFNGNMTNWKRFANSLKLRILLRESQVPSLDGYVKTEMAKVLADPNGFITADVVVQPGYLQSAGQQNPFYNRYGFTPAQPVGNATERRYQLPSNYLLAQYVDNKDPRVSQLYLPIGGKFIGANLGERLSPLGQNASLMKRFGGLLKGPDAATPLMLLSEHLFSKAEAEARGLITGNAKADYLAGIKASFTYFYAPATSQRNTINDLSASATPSYDKYIADNLTNPKVDFDLAPNKQEVIIFQKYLALNTVASTEAWADYRRTGFPKQVAGGAPGSTFASETSTSTRPDKLPVRLLYPQSEVTTNASNLPKDINQFTSKIFWDVVD